VQRSFLEANSGRSIGAILIDSGLLSVELAEQVLRKQKEEGLRFGDAAVQLGLLTDDDIQQALSRQYAYPYLTSGESQVSEEVVAAYKPFSPLVEQMRVLRSQLMLRWFDCELSQKTLAVVSPDVGEGRSFIAANLAVVFSQLGEKTLLIDADLRTPRQHKLFGLDNKLGLSTLLSGRAELGDVINKVSGLVDLSILPAGAIPPNPQELIGRPAFGLLLAQLKAQFDVILIDTPAAGVTADMQMIAARAQATLIVARKNFTFGSSLQSLVSMLRNTGVTVVGSVLNNG
jgi:protein-tyrosine kinase